MLSPVLTINLISRCCIPEALGDVLRAKSIYKFKLSSFYPSLSVSPHVDIIKFRTSWTSHENKHFGCGERELNISDKREHIKRCFPIGLSST